MSNIKSYHHQRGIALCTSMIFLSILTLLGISAMRSTTMNTKIAVNHQMKQMSFQAAESALARLTGANPNANVPLTETSAPVVNTNYFQSTGVPYQPNMSADLTMKDLQISAPGQYKFSGFGLGITTLVYTAEATGQIVGSNSQTQNRMQVALVRN